MKQLWRYKKRPTFSEIVSLWKDEKRQYVKQSTYAAYCFLLQNHLLPAFGSMRDITDAAVQQFVNCKLSFRRTIRGERYRFCRCTTSGF